MVGGASYLESKFNRAVQSKRQPGSSFKPFIYTAAIEEGFLPNDTIEDAPISFKVWPNKWNPKGYWAPKNFDGRFHGEVTLRHALEQSLNIPAIKLLEQVGIDKAIDVARRMGIESRLEPALSLALGASEVTNLEITSAFGVLANNGVRFEPISITKIENRDGEILFEQEPDGKRVLDANVAAIMTDMMRGVITRGTGYQANIGRPAAAKTGTSQNFHDAWFVGFVPQLVTGVWVGNDNNAPMRGIAEVSICPRIWKAYNIAALAGQPIYGFPVPVLPREEEKKIDPGNKQENIEIINASEEAEDPGNNGDNVNEQN
jgi:penicillin-binding protein 1A